MTDEVLIKGMLSGMFFVLVLSFEYSQKKTYFCFLDENRHPELKHLAYMAGKLAELKRCQPISYNNIWYSLVIGPLGLSSATVTVRRTVNAICNKFLIRN